MDIYTLGPKFEHNPAFPARTNTEFIEVTAFQKQAHSRSNPDSEWGARLHGISSLLRILLWARMKAEAAAAKRDAGAEPRACEDGCVGEGRRADAGMRHWGMRCGGGWRAGGQDESEVQVRRATQA